jgi:hypothetical protein
MLAPSHRTERAFEAGRIAHGEELFRIRAASITAQFLRPAELHVQSIVGS